MTLSNIDTHLRCLQLEGVNTASGYIKSCCDLTSYSTLNWHHNYISVECSSSCIHRIKLLFAEIFLKQLQKVNIAFR